MNYSHLRYLCLMLHSSSLCWTYLLQHQISSSGSYCPLEAIHVDALQFGTFPNSEKLLSLCVAIFLSNQSYNAADIRSCWLREPFAHRKNLCYSFSCDENLHTHVKSKIKWGNLHEFFSIFLIENELFTGNVRKRGSRQRTKRSNGQPTQLIRI